MRGVVGRGAARAGVAEESEGGAGGGGYWRWWQSGGGGGGRGDAGYCDLVPDQSTGESAGPPSSSSRMALRVSVRRADSSFPLLRSQLSRHRDQNPTADTYRSPRPNPSWSTPFLPGVGPSAHEAARGRFRQHHGWLSGIVASLLPVPVDGAREGGDDDGEGAVTFERYERDCAEEQVGPGDVPVRALCTGFAELNMGSLTRRRPTHRGKRSEMSSSLSCRQRRRARLPYMTTPTMTLMSGMTVSRSVPPARSRPARWELCSFFESSPVP